MVMDLAEVNEICNQQSKKIAKLESEKAELVEVLKETTQSIIKHLGEYGVCHEIVASAKQAIANAEGK